jgi:hypothetical protein
LSFTGEAENSGNWSDRQLLDSFDQVRSKNKASKAHYNDFEKLKSTIKN